MVRCEQFYEYWEKRGNFCGKSDIVAKKVEEYIGYVRRNRLSDYEGYKISNCALDPFINIEFINEGVVHRHAIKELKNLIRKRRISPEKVTRRISIELINAANMKVGENHKLKSIPNIRNRMGEYEHDIGEISHEIRDMFDQFKKDLGLKNNNQTMKIVLEWCIKNQEDVRKIKEEIENKEKVDNGIAIVKSV